MKQYRLVLLFLVFLSSFSFSQDQDYYNSKINAWYTTKVVTSFVGYVPLSFAKAGPIPVLITGLGIGIVDMIAPFRMDSYSQLAQGRETYGMKGNASDYRRKYRRLFWGGAGASLATNLMPTGIVLYEDSQSSGSATFTQQVTFNPVNAVVNTIFDIVTISVMAKQRNGVQSELSQLEFDFKTYSKNDVETYSLSVCFSL